MKFLISTDIEGVAGLTLFEETSQKGEKYPIFQKQMQKEVLQICQLLNGNITIKDAHGNGKNLNPEAFDSNIKLIQGFNSSLEAMVEGIDKDMDGVILHGYHSGAGTNLSPVAHTFNSKTVEYIKLNGEIVGETTIALYTCALYRVPIFYISGDSGAVLEAQKNNPNIVGTITKDFSEEGFLLNSDKVIRKIKKDLPFALSKLREEKELFEIDLPDKFELEMCFKIKNHRLFKKENTIKIDDYTLKYETKYFLEILKFLR